MGGWIIAPELGIEMVKVFLATAFTEGLEAWRQEFLKKAKTEFENLENAIYAK
jgi:ribose 5-phosphate isomerase B